MSGTNGLNPVENLASQRSKRMLPEIPPIAPTKCVAHPTKRMWTDPLEAIREAEARSAAAHIPIIAYRCDECGNAHLCKAENAREGTVLTREERVMPDEPIGYGNTESRKRALTQYLAGKTEVKTDEIAELLGLHRLTVRTYMRAMQWRNTKGRDAKWVPGPAPEVALEIGTVPNFEVFTGKGMSASNLKALDTAKSRHPSTQDVGWRPMTRLDPIRHMPLGDLIDTLHAAGMEIRIQVREI